MKTLIQLNNLSKGYGTVELFDKVNFGITSTGKIGVIGRNGSGKSTLCKMITGEEEPDAGTIDKHRDLRLSYLKQEDPFNPEETVMNFLMRSTKKEEWNCGKIAGRFHLKNELLTDTPIGKLSGGYQTRVKLTAMLLSEPNFLMLDEPSNFLDLHTLILLETFLQDYAGAFLIISHDREFLMKTCKETLEIERGKLAYFPGNIEEYLAYKEEQIEHLKRQNKNIEMKQRQLQVFIERFRAKNTKARQAQSKIKISERLKRIDIPKSLSSIRIRIPRVEVRKGYAVVCKDLNIGYRDRTVAEDITLHIDRGLRIAVLGDNGQGKTTFLRSIAGELPVRNGEYRWSKHSDIGYYAQNVYESLNPEEDVFTYLSRNAAPGVFRQDIMDMAGNFLFKGEDIYKPIGVLSGGERARLCLAGLLLAKKTVLLLDEPTNHLDFETVEALGAALHEYKGTVLFVSHDRTFVNMVTTGIIDVKDGRIIHYPGSYEEYVYHLKQTALGETDSFIQPEEKREIKPEKKKSDYHIRKELNSQINKLQKKIKEAERKIRDYEKEKKDIAELFSREPESYSLVKSQRFERLSWLIEEKEDIWFGLQDELEGLKRQLL